MQQIKEYIESGLLEQYVLGNATPELAAEIRQMALMHPEIASEIESIERSLLEYSLLNGIPPDEVVKPFLMATIDYSERIKNGEAISFPPEINKNTVIGDYDQWLSRNDLSAPGGSPDLYAKIIGYTPAMTTAIVWIKQMAPQETHHDEIEKFLIVEGSCEIIIGEEIHQLTPGDTLSIPLHRSHFVKVTSTIPCKVILQRVAA